METSFKVFLLFLLINAFAAEPGLENNESGRQETLLLLGLFDGSMYFYGHGNNTSNWTDARDQCQQNQMKLAEFKNVEHFDFVSNKIRENGWRPGFTGAVIRGSVPGSGTVPKDLFRYNDAERSLLPQDIQLIWRTTPASLVLTLFGDDYLWTRFGSLSPNPPESYVCQVDM